MVAAFGVPAFAGEPFPLQGGVNGAGGGAAMNGGGAINAGTVSEGPALAGPALPLAVVLAGPAPIAGNVVCMKPSPWSSGLVTRMSF